MDSSRRFPIPTMQESRAAAFTLIELLVVVAIITILVVSLVTLGSWGVGRAGARQTQTTLLILRDAAATFESEAPLAGVRQKDKNGNLLFYKARYGNYPPDELEVFTDAGLPGSDKGTTLGPSGAIVFPNTDSAFPPMKFWSAPGAADANLEHRDLAAMMGAIDLFSEAARSTLDKLPTRFLNSGVTDAAGRPTQFIDYDADGDWDPADGDTGIRYPVDAWGIPMGYMAQRDFPGVKATQNPKPPVPSSNDPAWNQASTEMIRLNGGAPLFFSYGPNGPQQLTQPNVGSILARDWIDDSKINHPLNDDNVYADDSLAEALFTGGR